MRLTAMTRICLLATLLVVVAGCGAPPKTVNNTKCVGVACPPTTRASTSQIVSLQFVPPTSLWALSEPFATQGPTRILVRNGSGSWETSLQLSQQFVGASMLIASATVGYVSASYEPHTGVPSTGSERLWITTDAGRKWSSSQLPSSCPNGITWSRPVSSSNAWLLCNGSSTSPNVTNATLYVTQNAGQRWVARGQVGLTGNPAGVAFFNLSHGIIATSGVQDGITIYLTNDGGQIWTHFQYTLPYPVQATIGLIPASSEATLLVSGGSPHDYQLVKSGPWGEAWHAVGTIRVSGSESVVSLRWFSRTTGVAVFSHAVATTTDGGTSWRVVPVSAQILVATFKTSADGWVLTQGISQTPVFSLLVTSDGGAAWHSVQNP